MIENPKDVLAQKLVIFLEKNGLDPLYTITVFTLIIAATYRNDIENWNKDILQNGLKIGQEIYVSKPSALDVKTNQIKSKVVSNATTHLVQAKETKYGISR